ncbi:MAG TPA: methylmalonyl-CoA mutase family protein [candidate division Zixibacteria bacterium]|nr:methylmalonyl-CoA mutase family protein [candidate division Zixibacteria bacterium]
MSDPERSAPRPHRSSSGIEIDPCYGPEALAGFDPQAKLGRPGEYPFTRGVRPDGYRNRLWTMRQYAGFGSAAETNRRFRYLLERGQTGLSVAFDLPTQMGYDSDAPQAEGEVGRTGVPIDTLADMEALFEGIRLDAVSTSMTINATAAILLVLYEVVGRRQGVDPKQLRGTIQNDILKEYIARGTYIYPPEPSMRLVTDTFAYCRAELPSWNTISISGYHMREAGATAAQEVAFTIANAIAYADAALRAGLQFDEFAPRLSFFFAAHNDLFEEVAKFRVARRVWAKVARERFGAQDPRSMAMRFHVQTGGSTLTAQQPDTNVVRTTVQALAAVLGGAQSLHTNALDEALGLPTPETARLALRTQQVLAYESGAAATADPLAGSYYVEWLTDRLEERIWAELDEIEQRGGTLAALEEGYQQGQIADAAYAFQRQLEEDERIVVGLNAFTEDGAEQRPQPQVIDPELERSQVERTRALRASRDAAAAATALEALETAARGTENVLPRIRTCVEANVTLGEISDALRRAWGEHRP